MAKKAEVTGTIAVDMYFVKVLASAVKHLKRTDDNGQVYRGVRLDMYQTKKDLKAILMIAGIREHATWAKTSLSCKHDVPCNDCLDCAFNNALEQAVGNGLLFKKDIIKRGDRGGVMNFIYTPEEWNPTRNVNREMIDTVLAEARTA